MRKRRQKYTPSYNDHSFLLGFDNPLSYLSVNDLEDLYGFTTRPESYENKLPVKEKFSIRIVVDI